MAPTRAPNTTCTSTMPGCTMPLPIVAATLRWKTKIATRLKKAANTTAWPGLSTRVETTVAIEFAASWKPFMKSNASASTTRNTIIHRVIGAPVMPLSPKPSPAALRAFQDDALDQVRHVLAFVGHRLEQLIDLLLLDDLLRVILLAEELRERGAEHAVG